MIFRVPAFFIFYRRKTMKKTIISLLIVTLIATIFCGAVGCNPTGNTDPSSLVIWHDKEEAVITPLQDYVKKALPNITVTFERKSSLTDSLKLVGNDPNSAPDMFIFAHDKIGVFAEMNILTPVTDIIGEDFKSEYLPMTLSAVTYKEKLYQLPLYFETLLFMYNSKYMLENEVPETTDELLEYMKNNTGRGRYGFVEQHSTAYYSAGWIHAFGGCIIDDSGTPFPNGQAVKDALNYHTQFVNLMPGESEYNTVNTLFLNGKADATIGGPWMVPSARDAGIKLGIAPMPTVTGTRKSLAPYSGVQGIHVLKFAAENKAQTVKDFLNVLTASEVGIRLAMASGCAPAKTDCYDDERIKKDEMVQIMRQTAEIAVPMPNIPEMDVMWTVVDSLLIDVNLKKKNIDASFDTALEKANSLIDAMK